MLNYKVYTGPTQVPQTAQRLRDAGLTVTLEGTEHVYVQADTADDVLAGLPAGGYSYRDVKEVR